MDSRLRGNDGEGHKPQKRLVPLSRYDEGRGRTVRGRDWISVCEGMTAGAQRTKRDFATKDRNLSFQQEHSIRMLEAIFTKKRPYVVCKRSDRDSSAIEREVQQLCPVGKRGAVLDLWQD